MKKILVLAATVLLLACVTGMVFAANTVPVYEQLLAAESLADFRSILLAEENKDEVNGLTFSEITNLSARVEFLYASIAQPSEDDIHYKGELLETLSILPNGPETLYGDPTTYATVALSDTINGTETSSHERHTGFLLADGTTYTISGTVTVGYPIIVQYGVTATIQGTGTFIHGTSGYKRDLFYIEPGGTLIIKGEGTGIILNGTNNQAENNSMVWCQGGLQLENVHFKNSSSSNTYAAALTLNQGDGYMYVDGSNKNTSGNPTNNDAAYPDGTNADRAIIIKNCSFADFSAPYAGAVKMAGKGNSVLMENVTFTNCKATSTTTGYAGALQYVADMPLTMTNCTFTSCSAATYAGGMIIDTAYTVTMTDTTFDGCTASTYGHAVTLYGNRSADVTMTGVQVRGCQKVATSATTLTYGAIASYTDSCNYRLSLDTCTFSSNEANSGAGIYWNCGSSATLTVKDCTFDGNTASAYSESGTTSYYEGRGGAIYVDTDLVATVTGSKFIGNTARTGGACQIYGPSSFTGCTFKENTSVKDGGACTFEGNTTIDGCTVSYTGTDDTAAAGGAFRFTPVSGADLVYDVKNTTISGTKSNDGSAILLGGDAVPATVKLYRVLIEGCTSTSGTGGTIRASGIQCWVLTVDQCVFRNNSHVRGGVFYWNCNGEGAGMTIKDSQFLNNSATVNGGALFLEATCTIQGSSGSMTNALSDDANAISEEIVGTLFQGNSAADKGGAICIATYNDASRKDTNNYFNSTSNEVVLSGNVSFEENKADIGGAIAYDVYNSTCYADDYIFNLICDGTAFSGNEATSYGGAIFLEYNPLGGNKDNVRSYGTDLGYMATLTVEGSAQFEGNKSPLGGAVYVGMGQCTVESATVKGNTSTGDGGAVYITATPIPVNGTTFTVENKRTTFSMSAGTFSGNAAVDGGAVAIMDGDVNITGGTMDRNTASNNGGAIYVNGGDFTMTSGTLSNNTAANMGGGLAVNSGNAVIGLSECQGNGNIEGHICPVIKNNTATVDGGGIAVTGGTTTMYCGNLESNSCTENQASNSYFQEQTDVESIFYIYGGDLDIGVSVENGTFNDYRESDGYNVTYHAVYDTVDTETSERVAGSFVTLPGEEDLNNSTFVRSGMVLLGWSLTEGAETGFLPVGYSLTLTSDTDLYAVWKNASYSITYVLGNSSVSGNPGTYSVTTDSQSITLNQPTPTDGTTFMGWSLTSTDGNWTRSDINGATLLAGGKYGNISLTAQWQKVDYTITYNFGCDDYTDPGNPNGFTSSGLPITLLSPTRPGYTFTGWHLNSTSGTVVTELTAYENYSLHATWEINTYVVTFDANGGTLSGDSSADYTIIMDIRSQLPTVTRAGYEFVGWRATSVDGNWKLGEAYSSGAGKYGKVTLQAQWERSLVDLTLNISGAEAEKSILVTITGTPTNSEETFNTLRFALIADSQGAGTITVSDLPVGKYKVVVEDNWSWRYDSTSTQLDSSDQIQVSTDCTISFTFTQSIDRWLNGYSIK